MGQDIAASSQLGGSAQPAGHEFLAGHALAEEQPPAQGMSAAFHFAGALRLGERAAANCRSRDQVAQGKCASALEPRGPNRADWFTARLEVHRVAYPEAK